MGKIDLNEHMMNYGELLQDAVLFKSTIKIDEVCKYGVKILDQYLGGILPAELVVIGADSGLGKSDLAYTIALENAKRGKKVALFALEGDIYEIAYRHLQREISKEHDIKTIHYRFNLNSKYREYEKEVISKVDIGISERLHIFRKKDIPTMELVGDIIKAGRYEYDMFIIDHLHYISYSTDNENKALGDIMREIKTITDITKKPVILMSHLRKRDTKKRSENNEPVLEDLYGSSNIGKEATTVILLNRMNRHDVDDWSEAYENNPKRFNATKMLVVKSRAGLPQANFGLLYDRVHKKYSDEKGHQTLLEDESRAGGEDRIDE